MIRTGNIFFDFISFLALVLPLLPAITVFFKKNYNNDSLVFLMLLCFLSFVRSLLLFIPNLNDASQTIIANIFGVAEFIILTFIFKTKMFLQFKSIINLVFAIIISVIITIYLLKGPAQKIFVIEQFENSLIVFMSVLCIAELTGSSYLHIFDKPVFWIAVGSLFYFVPAVLLKSLISLNSKNSDAEISGTILLLSIANIVKYFFYLLAFFFYKNSNQEITDKLN
ncbi:MAG TPA: hypothetical protein VMT76_08475 [Puia sp.]|nr:hypothetical protein [Puia sp.]